MLSSTPRGRQQVSAAVQPPGATQPRPGVRTTSLRRWVIERMVGRFEVKRLVKTGRPLALRLTLLALASCGAGLLARSGAGAPQRSTSPPSGWALHVSGPRETSALLPASPAATAETTRL